jgi:hypothetical protein
VTVASPDAVRTTPIVSPAMDVPAAARRHSALSRRATVTVFFIFFPSGFPA